MDDDLKETEKMSWFSQIARKYFHIFLLLKKNVMKNLIKKESFNLVLVALPFIYLGYLYGGLPAEVPVHWNVNGVADRMGSKSTLWMVPFLLPLLTYVTMAVVPALDPKKKIEKMGGKYQSFKTMMVAFMSVLAIYIIYSAANPGSTRISVVVVLMGLLFMGMGNFFKTIQPNYFIGIRTPWALENETVWKETHRLTGMLFLGGGLIIVLAGILLNNMVAAILLIIITLAVVLIPAGYSWMIFKKVG